MFRLSCPHMHLHTHTHSSSVVTSHNSISLHTRIMFMTSFLFLSFPVATLPRFPPCHSHMAQFQAPNCSRSVAPDGGRCRRRSRRSSSLSPRLKHSERFPRRRPTTPTRLELPLALVPCHLRFNRDHGPYHFLHSLSSSLRAVIPSRIICHPRVASSRSAFPAPMTHD